jgi:hypothetical protein
MGVAMAGGVCGGEMGVAMAVCVCGGEMGIVRVRGREMCVCVCCGCRRNSREEPGGLHTGAAREAMM